MNVLLDYDLKSLRVFKAIADDGGLSAAELSLGMSLPMISTYLSGLEQRLGVRLCNRGRGGFELTNEGLSLYRSLDSLLVAIEAFHGDVDKIRAKISGTLNVGVIDNTLSDTRLRLPQAIKAVKDSSNALSISLSISSFQEIENALLNGSLNIGIGPFRKRYPQLLYQPLYEETLNLYCSADHPILGNGRSSTDIALDDLQGFDYVSRGYLRESKTHRYLAGFNRSAEVRNMEAAAAMVMSGRFIGFLPEHYVSRFMAGSQLQIITPKLFSHKVWFRTAVREDNQSLKAVQAFLSALHEQQDAQ